MSLLVFARYVSLAALVAPTMAFLWIGLRAERRG